jgi:hypothetical protein
VVSAKLFALPPAPYRHCVDPSPEPKPARFQKGDAVVWLPDRETGTVVAVTCHAVWIEWDESEFCVYNLDTLAARERIAILEPDPYDL